MDIINKVNKFSLYNSFKIIVNLNKINGNSF